MITPDEMTRMAEEAGESGARKVLAELGLDNGHRAARDIRELRDLLHAWRAVRRTALQTMVRVLTTILLLALILGLAIKLRLFGGQ